MYYECRRCGLEEYRGCLPGVTCGLLLSVWAGLSGGAIVVAVRLLFPGGIGAWWLLVGPAIVVVSFIPGSVVLHLLAMSLEWLVISTIPCKGCRSHRFSFGKTHGFGL
jgi:hypothetical protein